MSLPDIKFEKFYGDLYGESSLNSWHGEGYHLSTVDFAWQVWQAATTEANKRIAELESEIAEVNRSYITLQDSTTLIANKYLESQAHINHLREALEVVFNNIELFKSMWMRVPTFGDKVNKATRQAISEATSPIFIAFNETQKALSATKKEGC